MSLERRSQQLSPEEMENLLEKKILAERQKLARCDQELQRLEHKTKSAARRQRAHRLIQLGAIIEHWLGIEGNPDRLECIMERRIFTDSDELFGEYLRELYLEAQDS